MKVSENLDGAIDTVSRIPTGLLEIPLKTTKVAKRENLDIRPQLMSWATYLVNDIDTGTVIRQILILIVVGFVLPASLVCNRAGKLRLLAKKSLA